MKEHGGSSRLVRRLILGAMAAALAMALVAPAGHAKPGEGNGSPAANGNGHANPPGQGNPAPSQGNRGNGNPGRGNGNANRGGRGSTQAAPPASHNQSRGHSRGNGAASNGQSSGAQGRGRGQARRGDAGTNPGQSGSRSRGRGNGGSKGRGRGGEPRGNNGAAHQKTTICHATGSDTNPYVEITISDRALDAHRRHQHGEDIVPAPAGGCPQGQRVAELLGPFGGVVASPGNEHGKTTICHATGSETNPYVVITVSDNALDAHRAHQHGEDIIPAPAEGCPGSEQAAAGSPSAQEDATAPAPGETGADLVGSEGQSPAGAVLGAEESSPGAQAQAPVADAGNAATDDEDGGSLPFTGLELIAVVALGAAFLLAGVAGRRAIARRAA